MLETQPPAGARLQRTGVKCSLWAQRVTAGDGVCVRTHMETAVECAGHRWPALGGGHAELPPGRTASLWAQQWGQALTYHPVTLLAC